MKTKRKDLVTVWLFVGVLLVGGIVLQGCKESEPSGSDASQKTDGQKWSATDWNHRFRYVLNHWSEPCPQSTG